MTTISVKKGLWTVDYRDGTEQTFGNRAEAIDAAKRDGRAYTIIDPDTPENGEQVPDDPEAD